MKQMGRESNDHVVNHSSIALLQERFKQLQRMKEMREEREFSRMAKQPGDAPDRTPECQQYSNPPLIRGEPRMPPRSPPRAPFSLCPSTTDYYSNHQRAEIPLLVNLMSSGPNSNRDVYDKCTQANDSDDVDTSLHL
ncbi:hypothetical protein EUGRSUZ_E03889 [Eucalyptus grandis]|uniref:Uncharacterized protein n=3 Tax=Eucalyptus TaxID=3932 RepID=A0ACC3L0H0_EUCGR|nr:hypothetical protein EUGRSUZ_E03889 [Eucalyptus grandis]